MLTVGALSGCSSKVVTGDRAYLTKEGEARAIPIQDYEANLSEGFIKYKIGASSYTYKGEFTLKEVTP